MRSLVKILSLLLLAVALPAVVVLVMRNQETRKGAAANETSFTVLPSVVNVETGQDFSVSVWVNTGNDVDKLQGAELSIAFTEKIQFVSAAAQNGYNILNDVIDDHAGNLSFKIVTLGAEKSGAMEFIKIYFKALSAGNQVLVVKNGKLLINGQTALWNVSNNVSSVVTVADIAQPTVVLTVAPIVPVAVPTPNGVDLVLNYKISLANVNPNSSSCMVNPSLKIMVVANGQSKSFSNVIPQTREVVGDKVVFGGRLILVGFTESENVSVFISGPKHLQTKYGQNSQTSSYNKAIGELSLTKTEAPVYDFSGYPLEAGDVVSNNSESDQDGRINGADFAYVKSKALTHETVQSGGFLRGDLDGNCQVNSNDVNMLKMSLQDKQAQLY